MQTKPPGTPADHFARLKRQLEEYLPEVKAANLCFYNVRKALRVFAVELVPQGALLNETQLVEILNRAIGDGCEWFNMAGEGFLWDGRYICSYDHAPIHGRVITLVEVSGPSLLVNRSPRVVSPAVVGLLEELAGRLRLKGLEDVANRLPTKYARRQSGDWEDEKLLDFSREQFRTFERTLNDYIGDFERKRPANEPLRRYHDGCVEMLRRLLRNCRSDERSELYQQEK